MITQIKKGDRFVCVATNKLIGAIVGNVYTSDKDTSIALEPNYWCSLNNDAAQKDIESFNQHFIPYTYEALHAYLFSLKGESPEATLLIALLKDLDRSIGRSNADRWNYRGRLADPDTQHEMEAEAIKADDADQVVRTTMGNDPVNNPSHYTDGKIEVIDFIEDKQLNFHLGNAVKYISRAGKKDPGKTVQDLQKAVWYIQREITRLGGGVSCE